MTILLAVIIAVTALVLFIGGMLLGTNLATRDHIARLGFTVESAKLYKRAAKILARMQTVTELEGDLTPDILSPRSRELLDAWLADYRKQIDKV